MDLTSIKYGVYGGLAGGVVFGAMMGIMGRLSMVGNMVGIPTIWAGFLTHMMISATIGAMFALLVQWTGWSAGIGTGLSYGALWWILGPLTLMPLFMGMGIGASWNATALAQAMPSLMGHLIFGGILGSTYAWLDHANAHGYAYPHHAGAV